MNRHNRFTLSILAAVLSASALASGSAHADDASCKPVTDAMTKATRTPYHEAATAGGKSFEKIYTTTALYVGRNGHWVKMPASPQTLIDAMHESGATFTECKSLRTEMVDGQPATVYAAHERLTSVGEDDHGQYWVGNVSGLPLKSESDSQHGGPTSHVSTHFTYNNVQPPVGVQ